MSDKTEEFGQAPNEPHDEYGRAVLSVASQNKLQSLAKQLNLSEGVLLKTMIDFFWDNFRDKNFRKYIKLWEVSDE